MVSRFNLRSILLVFVPLVVAACGDDGGSGAGALTGRTFLSESVTVSGQPTPLVPGTQIRLSFLAGDRITASSGCNMVSGTVRSDADHLLISGLGSTEMGCDPPRHTQDEWLSSVLAANPRYVLDGNRLELHGGDTVMYLLDRDIADPDRPLRQTVWLVDGFIDGTTASSIPAGTAATVVFGDGTVNVAIDSCNKISGRARFASSSIEIDQLVTTDVACNGPAAAVQATIVAVLDGKVTYAIEAASLRLLQSGGKGLTLRAQ